MKHVRNEIQKRLKNDDIEIVRMDVEFKIRGHKYVTPLYIDDTKPISDIIDGHVSDMSPDLKQEFIEYLRPYVIRSIEMWGIEVPSD